MTLFISLLGFVLLYWTIESLRLHRALRAIPIRIHVNGSRGKSSVTRLLAAALREAGIRTAAKVTGSRARFIHTDGSETPIIRLGTPNICEQVGVFDRARKEKAEVMVIECMAIRPDLQKTTEKRIVHSTIGIITNIRADHLDVMGPTVADAAIAISSTIPKKGIAFVGPTRHFARLKAVADRRKTRLEVAAPSDLPAGAMDGFTFLEHEENVAAALAVSRTLGVADDVALRGMYRVTPDPGACTRWELEYEGRRVVFHNIFAANDLESTAAIWKRLGLDVSDRECPAVALVNMRSDRVDRSLQFAEAAEAAIRADYYMLVGDFTGRILRRFERRVPEDKLIVLGKASPARVFERLAGLGDGGARVGGIANIGGLGHEILRFAERWGGGSS